MKGLLTDLRHAFRLYRHTPVTSLIAVVVLAIGMAFVGSFLSLYVDLVLRPHPGLDEGSRIVTIGLDPGTMRLGLLDRMVQEVTSLEVIAGVYATTLETGPEREERQVEFVTSEVFPGFHPRLALGRGFDDSDHAIDAAPVAVISDTYWRERFGRSPDVVGRVVEIPPRNNYGGYRTAEEQERLGDSEPTAFQIVGVIAPGMSGLFTSDVDLWLPLERAVRLIYPPERVLAERDGLGISVIGRRARGISAIGVASELEARYSDINDFSIRPGVRIEAIDGIVRNFDRQRETKRQLQMFLAGSLLLALVAAANVSLFLLARAPGRRRELGVRMAVGAPPGRLSRQLASESALLVLTSAALGLMMSVWLSDFLRSLSFLRRAEWTDVTLLDWRVLGLVAVFLLLVTLSVSLAPIFGLKRLGIAASSRQIAASATLVQRVAGTVQIAIAGMFAAAGVAFAWYLGSLLLGYPGYETEDLYAAEFRSQGGMFYGLPVVDQERQREAIASLAGVEEVAFGNPVPVGIGINTRIVDHPLDPTRKISFIIGTMDSRFMELLGFRFRFGRAPAEGEGGVAVINRSGARVYFGTDDVVGERLPITIAGRRGGSSEIIGVLEDLSFLHPAAEVEPLLFLTVPGDSNVMMGTVIRSSLSQANLQSAIQGLIDARTLETESISLVPLGPLRNAWIAPDRARGFLTIATACLVVLLATLGFYGTQRFLVAAGRREYAIRASLGAGPGALWRLVLRRGLSMSLPGLVVGGLLGFSAVAWMSDYFRSRGISAAAVAAIVVVGLVAILLLANLGPARDARRTRPGLLLRED